MTADLIQRLRTCSSEERGVLAQEAAHAATDDVVAELKSMVQGGVRDYTPGTYATLWSKKPIRYSGEDSLTGIQALAETHDARVLEYLRFVYAPRIDVPCLSGMYESNEAYEVWTYPNAGQELANRLHFQVFLGRCSQGSNGYCITERDDQSIENERREIPAAMQSHQIIRTAIKRLESSLKDEHRPSGVPKEDPRNP